MYELPQSVNQQNKVMFSEHLLNYSIYVIFLKTTYKYYLL